MMLGNQRPRIRIEPERAGTDGTAAAMLMAEYGYKLDEWQQLVLDAWLGKDECGQYNVTSAGLSVARQNGKSAIIEAREFYGLLVNGERILHTAHQVRTTKRAFRRLVNMFTDKRYPEVMQSVEKIRFGVGEESIQLHNGGIIEFTSRSRQTGRGFEGISLVVLDESQEITEDQSEAIISTLSASSTGIRQMIYVGTPVYTHVAGSVFRRFREGCIAASDDPGASCWHEWSVAADSVDKIDIADKNLWYACNPSLGIRLTEEFTEQEMKSLTPLGFARERLGYWTPNTLTEKTELAIDEALWDSCSSNEPKPEGKTAYGVKFSVDGSEVVLCGAAVGDNGIARISLIERKPLGYGLSWLANWLNERSKRASCVVIDGRNGADVLIDKISDTWRFKNSVIKPSAQNVVTASSLLINELAEHSVTWFKRQPALRESAITATKRPIAGGWGFGGQDSAPIEAASLALWGVRTSKRNPQKVMRIG